MVKISITTFNGATFEPVAASGTTLQIILDEPGQAFGHIRECLVAGDMDLGTS